MNHERVADGGLGFEVVLCDTGVAVVCQNLGFHTNHNVMLISRLRWTSSGVTYGLTTVERNFDGRVADASGHCLGRCQVLCMVLPSGHVRSCTRRRVILLKWKVHL